MAAVCAAGVVSAHACGGSPTTPGQPSPPPDAPVVHSVVPASGPVSGGTAVTIRGARFAAGATVAIGGRAAPEVVVQNAETITAVTPPGLAAGTVAVTVQVGSRSGSLPSGFNYHGAFQNAAPIVQSITAQGRRPGQPAAFADVGEEIDVTAEVEDAETPPDQLVYEWRACGGDFNGTGRRVTWRAPAGGTFPRDCQIDVTVIERFQEAGASGEHRVTRTTSMRLHDSPKEIGGLALEFLTEFSNSDNAPETTIRNFSDSCPGKAAELEDVIRNRENYTITSHTLGTPEVTVQFGGVCGFRARRADACVAIPVQWRSTVKATGGTEVTVGTSYLTAIYQASRWWLCDSEFDGSSTTGALFVR